MTIKIRCDSCKSLLRAPEKLLGQVLPCPKCANPVMVSDVTVVSRSTLTSTDASYSAAPIDGIAKTQTSEDSFEEIVSSVIDEEPKTAQCPFCLETIVSGARKCKHCGEALDPDLKQYRELDRQRRQSKTEKRILPAFLLALFLGGLGAQRFYTGNTGSAVAILLMSVFGAMLVLLVVGLIPLTIVSIWVIVDLITLASGSFKDGDGVKITEWM